MTSYNKLTLDTRIIGIIGHPIKHSYSPLMHNISFELLKLNYVYLPFDVPINMLKTAINGMIALGIKGFNVTLPHKEDIINYLQNVSEEASIIGAVNTIVNENGILSGYNTDAYGVYETLRPYKDEISGSQVTIFGSGGGARSAIYTVIRNFKPEKIYIINRTEQRGESLKDYFSTKMHFSNIQSNELIPPDMIEILRDSKLIINTTSVGMHPNEDDSVTEIGDSFMNGQIVFDFIYNPVKTKLLQLAESQGAVTLDGLKMLVHQGAKAFELWTGMEMPVKKVHKAMKLYIDSK
ncbi:MAG: shikimate dehydrogenase [Ignavibacteria bacterium]